MKEFTIRVKMKERWIPHFMSMLKYIESLGNMGSSRMVSIYADGDGDFQAKFEADVDWEIKKPVKDEGGNRIYDLKKLIIENPTLPIKFFASDDCNGGDFGYEECFVSSLSIDEITLYGDEWLNEEDLHEKLEWNLYSDGMSESELKNRIDNVISDTKFEKTICIFLVG